jgi:aerobic-type carbon monoxide dehydrogenase small subunit (CoxS/CutS family)
MNESLESIKIIQQLYHTWKVTQCGFVVSSRAVRSVDL